MRVRRIDGVDIGDERAKPKPPGLRKLAAPVRGPSSRFAPAACNSSQGAVAERGPSRQCSHRTTTPRTRKTAMNHYAAELEAVAATEALAVRRLAEPACAEEFEVVTGHRAAQGAWLGAVAGLLAGALALALASAATPLTLPVIGLLMAGQGVAAGLGALAGAANGALTGAVIGWGIPRERLLPLRAV